MTVTSTASATHIHGLDPESDTGTAEVDGSGVALGEREVGDGVVGVGVTDADCAGVGDADSGVAFESGDFVLAGAVDFAGAGDSDFAEGFEPGEFDFAGAVDSPGVGELGSAVGLDSGVFDSSGGVDAPRVGDSGSTEGVGSADSGVLVGLTESDTVGLAPLVRLARELRSPSGTPV